MLIWRENGERLVGRFRRSATIIGRPNSRLCGLAAAAREAPNNERSAKPKDSNYQE